MLEPQSSHAVTSAPMASVALKGKRSDRLLGLGGVPPQRRRVHEWDGPTLVGRPYSGAVTAFRGVDCPAGTGCSRPAWLVTAPYRQPRSESRSPIPWGTYHVKENGGLLTACGESVIDWHVFWDMDVDVSDDTACPECVRAVGADASPLAELPAVQAKSSRARPLVAPTDA